MSRRLLLAAVAAMLLVAANSAVRSAPPPLAPVLAGPPAPATTVASTPAPATPAPARSLAGAVPDTPAAVWAVRAAAPARQRWLTWRGCNWRHGLHNQRQAFGTAVLAAVVSGRGLRLAPYVANVHDNETQLRIPDLWDVDSLRRALHPLPVSAADDGDLTGWVPFKTAFSVDGALPLDLLGLGRALAAEAEDRVALQFPDCWGSVVWKVAEGNSDEVADWAAALLRAAVVTSAPIAAASRALLAAAAALKRSAASAVHSVHVRAIRPGIDFLPFPYPPLVDCSTEGLNAAPRPCQGTERGRTCRCVDGDGAEVDYDGIIGRRARGGQLRPGDVLLIAASDPSSPRTTAVARAAEEAGARPVIAAHLAESDTRTASAMAALRSQVQRGAAELTAVALADGFFLPACGATSSEYAVILRRTLGRPGAAEQIGLLRRVENSSMACLRELWRPTPAPSEAVRRSLKGRKLSSWLAQRSRLDAARR